MIPKVIHYCWFGGNALPEAVLKCIESWRRNCPDYSIVEWNESNYDINKHQYVKEAYEAKKWAFVSDFARLDIIYNNGGVYLDTDVEVIRPIDEMLANDCFLAAETTGFVATGLGFGAVKNNAIIKKLLDEYENAHFRLSSGQYDTMIPCPKRNTEPLSRMGYKYSEKDIWTAEGVTVFPPEYFCPIDYNTNQVKITDKTVSIHHYSGLWISKEERDLNAAIEEMERKNGRIAAFFKRQKMKYDFEVKQQEVKNWFEYLYRKTTYKLYRIINKR